MTWMVFLIREVGLQGCYIGPFACKVYRHLSQSLKMHGLSLLNGLISLVVSWMKRFTLG